MHDNSEVHAAIAAMTAAKASFADIPDDYDGKDHLGLTITALDRLVTRVIALHSHLESVPRRFHG